MNTWPIIAGLVITLVCLMGIFVLYIKVSKAEGDKIREEMEKQLREDIKAKQKRVLENEKAKERMETGNARTDFDNSVDIVSKL